jgi:hypothetical protein
MECLLLVTEVVSTKNLIMRDCHLACRKVGQAVAGLCWLAAHGGVDGSPTLHSAF